MNSYTNPFVPKAITDTGEEFKVWFCSRRLADLIIKKVNLHEWRRIYFSLEINPWGDYKPLLIGLDGMIVMIKEQ